MKLIHRGKIGRLPLDIQEQVNVRLRQGERGHALCGWLNSLPEVRALLAAEFGGKPVREQNLSEWRKGGYQLWLRLQEAYTMMERMGPEVAALNGAAKEPMTETLATWVTAQYMVNAKSVLEEEAEPGAGWKRMREFCSDVMALRRGELRSRRLDLERDKSEAARAIREFTIRDLRFTSADAADVSGSYERFRAGESGRGLPQSRTLARQADALVRCGDRREARGPQHFKPQPQMDTDETGMVAGSSACGNTIFFHWCLV